MVIMDRINNGNASDVATYLSKISQIQNYIAEQSPFGICKRLIN